MDSLSSSYLTDSVEFVHLSSDIFPLVNHFYKNQKIKVHCGKDEQIFVLRHKTEIFAALRLLPMKADSDTETIFLLRNLLVAKERRGQGFAQSLMLEMLNKTQKSVYLFSLSHLVNFYQSLGFQCPQESDPLPSSISQLNSTYKARHRDWVLMFKS